MTRAPLARTTVREALDSALIALTASGCETPRLDAELLLAEAMGVSRAAIVAGPERGLDPAHAGPAAGDRAPGGGGAGAARRRARRRRGHRVGGGGAGAQGRAAGPGRR